MEHEPSHTAMLSADDAAAVDWLEANGWEPAGVPPELRPRVDAVLRLLDQVGSAESGQSVENAGLVSRLHALLGLDDRSRPEPMLDEADADALDAWLLAGRRLDRVPSALRDRARVHGTIAMLLTSPGESASDPALTERTLAAIRSADIPINNEPRRFRLSARLSDLVSLAAVVLIGASVLLPVLSSARAESRRLVNESNMAVAGLGFGTYAADHRGALPQRAMPQPGARWIWWNVGAEDPAESNSANLYSLHRLGYTPLDALASPGNPAARLSPASAEAEDWQSLREVSYSYRLSRDAAASVDDSTIILTDRSPVVLRIAAREPVRIDENSPNHGGRGQHVLRGDGSVSWSETPWNESGDHMFLPREIEQIIDQLLTGRVLTFERLPGPNREADAFVAP